MYTIFRCYDQNINLNPQWHFFGNITDLSVLDETLIRILGCETPVTVSETGGQRIVQVKWVNDIHIPHHFLATETAFLDNRNMLVVSAPKFKVGDWVAPTLSEADNDRPPYEVGLVSYNAASNAWVYWELEDLRHWDKMLGAGYEEKWLTLATKPTPTTSN